MATITLPTFVNEPLSDFSDPDARVQEKINNALAFIRSTILGHTFPLIVGGKEQFTKNIFTRVNPSQSTEIIGRVSFASPRDVDECIHVVQTSGALQKWTCASFEERGAYLRRVAKKFREKRFFFIALMMLEIGKSAPEADAEVSEAIDFLEWYALYAPFVEELCNKTLASPLGEKNSAMHIPVSGLPICTSIQPWNFPLAISVGPAAAALVCGYAVLYKPSEQASVIGCHIAGTFLEAGIPKEVFHFVPGYGEEIGSYLVGHPAISAVAFTGSKKVRQEIQYAIARFNNTEIERLPFGNRYEKRALALESGGKNAIIVDSDADLDEAVVGVSDSAFGFQGQKCSACSRLIIVDKEGNRGRMYRMLMERLGERVKSLPIGSPENPEHKIGPLIDEEAVKKFHLYVNIAKEEGCRVFAEGNIPQNLSGGHFVSPVILEDVPFDSRVAHEEVFGPLLSVFSVSTFDGAIFLANNTEFALTAGVYSRSERHIELAKRNLRAGNIYINRKTTGASVGRQPFGGFKMSGNSTKAGGWDYLLSFLLDRKHIAENTMRRGIPVES